MAITGHEIEYHLDIAQMLKFLGQNTSLYDLAKRLGISKSALYNYKIGARQVKNKSIYEAVLKEYYRLFGKHVGDRMKLMRQQDRDNHMQRMRRLKKDNLKLKEQKELQDLRRLQEELNDE